MDVLSTFMLNQSTALALLPDVVPTTLKSPAATAQLVKERLRWAEMSLEHSQESFSLRPTLARHLLAVKNFTTSIL